MKYAKLLQKKLLISILIVAGLIVAAGIYMWTMTSQANAEDQKRYENLQQSVATLRDQLQKRNTSSAPWSDAKGWCGHHGGDQFGKGKEWYCFVSTDTTLYFKAQSETDQAITTIIDTVKSSPEYDVPPKDNLLQTLSQTGKVSLVFMHKPSQAECKMIFKNDTPNKTFVEVDLNCGGGALRSWYQSE